jgi:hypothetical protein
VDPIELFTADLRPIVPEAQRLRLARAIARVLKSSPLGSVLDEAAWSASLFRNMEQLCNGIELDFAPIRNLLQKRHPFSEADIFVLFERVRLELQPMGIRLKTCAWTLSESTLLRLKVEAHEAPPHHQLSSRTPRPVQGKPTPIGELLVSYGVIDKNQLEEALRMQQYFGGRIGTTLVQLNMVDPETMAHFLGVRLGMPSIHAHELEDIPQEVLELMSLDLVVKYQAVPVAVTRQKLRVAMLDPTDLSSVDAIAFATGYRIEAAVAPERMLAAAMDRYYGLIIAPEMLREESVDMIVTSPDEQLVISDDRSTLMNPKEDFGNLSDGRH